MFQDRDVVSNDERFEEDLVGLCTVFALSEIVDLFDDRVVSELIDVRNDTDPCKVGVEDGFNWLEEPSEGWVGSALFGSGTRFSLVVRRSI